MFYFTYQSLKHEVSTLFWTFVLNGKQGVKNVLKKLWNYQTQISNLYSWLLVSRSRGSILALAWKLISPSLSKFTRGLFLLNKNLDIFNTAPAGGSPFSSSGQFKEKFTVNDSNLWVKIKPLAKDQTPS